MLTLRRGTIFAVFQMEGVLACLTEKLKEFVRYSKPYVPKCCKGRIVNPSVLAAVELTLFLMVSVTVLYVKCG